jgi:NAD(P)H-hydrate epimerase
MFRFVSCAQMRKLDKLASTQFGIPALILMENAGRSVADEAEDMFKHKTSQITVFCGYGNNGGDGFVAARHLVNRGYKVKIYLVGRPKDMNSETRINFDILNRMCVKASKIHIKQLSSIRRAFNKTQLIIDAIFGIGIKGNLDDFYCKLIQMINDSKVPVLAIDIPSGLNADKGTASPIAIKAKKTATMGLIKKGFLNPSAKKFTGKVVVIDISLPRQLK